MSYEPNPVDTSRVDASILAPVTEQLAEHVHDLWAQGRIREGWTFGTERDGQTKRTPSLVPYAALPDTEKDYDRRSAIEPLKVLLAKGYSLSPPGAAPTTALAAPPAPLPKGAAVCDDDMLVDPDCKHASLNQALEFVKEETVPGYLQANGASARNQDKFRSAARWSVLCGVASVLIAIWQLTHPPSGALHYVLPALELLLVLTALSLVTCATMYRKWHLAWLSERSKAEQLRSAKFQFLLDPCTWAPATAAQSRARFREDVRAIAAAGFETLDKVLTAAGSTAPVPAQLTADRLLHESIASYYLSHRLAVQAKYFRRKAHEMHAADPLTKVAGYVLFFGVLVFVSLHSVTDVIAIYLGQQSPGGHAPSHPLLVDISRFFIMCAAMLPAVGAAVHTYRAGRETARNHLRFKTCYNRLSAIQGDLEASHSQPEQIRLMYASEATLASEHQQWLQLMYECEWFG